MRGRPTQNSEVLQVVIACAILWHTPCATFIHSSGTHIICSQYLRQTRKDFISSNSLMSETCTPLGSIFPPCYDWGPTHTKVATGLILIVTHNNVVHGTKFHPHWIEYDFSTKILSIQAHSPSLLHTCEGTRFGLILNAFTERIWVIWGWTHSWTPTFWGDYLLYA